MSKFLSLLFACLPVLLLASRIPERNGLYITYITDIDKYRAEHPGGVWQPFQQVDDQEWVLGKKNKNDLMYGIVQSSYSEQVISAQPKLYSIVSATNINCIKIKFEEYTDDVQVFLVDGGVGEKFASIIIKLPVFNEETTAFSAYLYFNRY